MPSRELEEKWRGDISMFLIIRIEDMYRHVKKPVPAAKSTSHSCLFVTEGEAVMKIGYEQYRVGQNELLFVPAGQVFSFGADDVNKGILCNFHDSMLRVAVAKTEMSHDFEFLRVWGQPLVCPDTEKAKFIFQNLQRMLTEYEQNGLQHQDLLRAYLMAFLFEVRHSGIPEVSIKRMTGRNIVQEFRQLLFDSPKKNLVADYAALLHVSPNHLNKVVKNVTGKSPGKWIDEAIVLEAKVLLSQTIMSISEVAAQVGIEDQSYFARLFKRYEGTTPSSFRKRIEKS